MRLLFLLPVIALAACSAPAAPSLSQGPSQADVDAVRQVAMSGPRLSWQDLNVHPTLMRRACAVSTLVNANGEVVGYCRGGRQCRTNDWRPVESGCNRSPEYRAEPASTPPAPGGTPGSQPGPAIDLARMR